MTTAVRASGRQRRKREIRKYRVDGGALARRALDHALGDEVAEQEPVRPVIDHAEIRVGTRLVIDERRARRAREHEPSPSRQDRERDHGRLAPHQLAAPERERDGDEDRSDGDETTGHGEVGDQEEPGPERSGERSERRDRGEPARRSPDLVERARAEADRVGRDAPERRQRQEEEERRGREHARAQPEVQRERDHRRPHEWHEEGEHARERDETVETAPARSSVGEPASHPVARGQREEGDGNERRPRVEARAEVRADDSRPEDLDRHDAGTGHAERRRERGG